MKQRKLVYKGYNILPNIYEVGPDHLMSGKWIIDSFCIEKIVEGKIHTISFSSNKDAFYSSMAEAELATVKMAESIIDSESLDF